MESQGFEKDGAGLLEYLRVVWRRKWLILFVTVGVFGIGMWQTYRTERLYEARVTIQLNSLNGAVVLERLGPMLGTSRGIESEMEILKSRVIGERAAVRLRRHYALSPLPRGVSLELADVRVTEKTLPGVYLLTFVDGAGEYRVKDPQGQVIGVGRPDRAFEAGGLSFVLSKVSAQSGSSFEIVIPKLAAVANALRGRLTVGVIRGTDIVWLGVRGNNPQEIAGTVNAFAETYVDFTRQQKIQQLLSIRQFLEKQLDLLRQDLLRTGKSLADVGSEQKGTESVLGVLRRSDPGGTSQADVRYEFARRLLELEMKRSALQFTYTPNHRLIAEIEREIAEVRSRLAKALQVERQDMPLQDLLQQSQAKLTMYNYMLQKQQETRLAEASELGSARIIDYAIPPEAPISPNVSRNMKMGAMLGLFLGIGLALVLGYLDNTVKDVKDMEDRVGLPVFGAIPEIARRGFRMKPSGIDEGTKLVDHLKLMLEFPSGTVAAEAYRALRTNIQFASPGLSVRSFLFTSAGPSEGKSLTVANLAIALSQMERRVLVIDADLRKPVQHRLFGVEAEVGLTDVLAKKVPWRQATIEGPVKNLDLIPSGTVPPNPAELLGGGVMRAFLTEVQQHYDLVLLDSSPTLIVADACVLAPLVEGVFLVVRAGVTTPEGIARAQSVLSTVNAKLIGTILNAIPTSNGFGPYGLGHHHYNYGRYHYSEDQSEKDGRLKQTAEYFLSQVRRVFKSYL